MGILFQSRKWGCGRQATLEGKHNSRPEPKRYRPIFFPRIAGEITSVVIFRRRSSHAVFSSSRYLLKCSTPMKIEFSNSPRKGRAIFLGGLLGFALTAAIAQPADATYLFSHFAGAAGGPGAADGLGRPLDSTRPMAWPSITSAIPTSWTR